MARVKEHKFFDTFETSGIWFLLGQDMLTQGVRGTLVYTPEQINLNLLDLFDSDEYDNMQKESVIFGFSSSGEWFSLYDCQVSGASTSYPGFAVKSYAINHFYIGTKMVEDESELLFTRCNFSLTYLDAWMSYGIIEERTIPESGRIELHIDPTFALEWKRKIELPKENIMVDEEISYRVNRLNDYYSSHERVVIENHFLAIKCIDKSLFNYEFALDVMHKIKTFITLLSGIPLFYTYIDLEMLPEITLDFRSEECKIQHKCRLFFRQVGDINKRHKVSPYDITTMKVNWRDISDCISDVYNYWFCNYKQISEIINPHISDLYLPLYKETKFLNTARSIETYHRYYVEPSLLQEKGNNNNAIEHREQVMEYIKNNIPQDIIIRQP